MLLHFALVLHFAAILITFCGVTNVKDESARLELPRTFTRNIIPGDRSEIPRPDVISRTGNAEGEGLVGLKPYHFIAGIYFLVLQLTRKKFAWNYWTLPYERVGCFVVRTITTRFACKDNKM